MAITRIAPTSVSPCRQVFTVLIEYGVVIMILRVKYTPCILAYFRPSSLHKSLVENYSVKRT
jgi:hypothetical protein